MWGVRQGRKRVDVTICYLVLKKVCGRGPNGPQKNRPVMPEQHD